MGFAGGGGMRRFAQRGRYPHGRDTDRHHLHILGIATFMGGSAATRIGPGSK